MDYHPVCCIDGLVVERGAAALVHGQAIALFRTPDGLVHALSNHDPFAHAFDLRTGRCLDDATVGVAVYDVRIARGVVLVGPRRHP